MSISEPDYYYSCERCGFECKLIADIKRHLNRKYQCTNVNNNNLNNDEININSMTKKYNKIDIENIIEKYKKLKQIEDTKKNEKKEKNKCNYCFLTYSTKGNLERHLNSCSIKKIINDYNKINNIDNKINNNMENNKNNNNTLLILKENKQEIESIEYDVESLNYDFESQNNESTFCSFTRYDNSEKFENDSIISSITFENKSLIKNKIEDINIKIDFGNIKSNSIFISLNLSDILTNKKETNTNINELLGRI